MRKYIPLSSLILTGVLLFNPANSEAAREFNDLGNSSSHHEAVNYFNSLGVYDYKTTNKLNGAEPVTRAEVAKIIRNTYGSNLPLVREYNNDFSDIKSTTKFAEDIIWAYEAGILDGYNGKFNPNNTLTRAQMAKIIALTFNIKEKGNAGFNDIGSSHWAYQYVRALSSNDIAKGNGYGLFLPENKVTLYQLSTFLYRAINFKQKKEELNKSEVIHYDLSEFGTPNAHSQTLKTEYKFDWNVITKGKNLKLEGVYNNKVVALYKTEIGSFISLAPSLKVGVNSATDVINTLGTPIKFIEKEPEKVFIGVYEDGKEYSVHSLGNYYVTFFYDTLDKNKILAIQAIEKSFEESKESAYGSTSEIMDARESSEDLMVLLINQAREAKGVSSLGNMNSKWNHVPRAHSEDMAANNFFNHVGSDRSTPSDRAVRSGMHKSGAGENIVKGPYNVIYAHISFMNSEGHRNNLLNQVYNEVVVGEAIDKNNYPYFTVMFMR